MKEKKYLSHYKVSLNNYLDYVIKTSNWYNSSTYLFILYIDRYNGMESNAESGGLTTKQHQNSTKNGPLEVGM